MTLYALVTSFALVTSYTLIVTSYALVIIIIKTIRGIDSCQNSIVDVRSLKFSTIHFIYSISMNRLKARKIHKFPYIFYAQLVDRPSACFTAVQFGLKTVEIVRNRVLNYDNSILLVLI